MAALALLAMVSCNKEPQNGGDDNNDAIKLSANTTAPAMNKDVQKEDVLILSWTPASNKGTGARVEYSLLIDEKGGSFESAYEIALGSNVTSYTATAGTLNKIIMGEFGMAAGESKDFDICIYAAIKSADVDDVISNTLTITLSAFEAAPEALWMVGSATAGGWDLAQATPMDIIEGEEGGFQWSGELGAGELKFLLTTDGWVPGYGREDDTHLYLRDHLWEDENGNRVDDEALPHQDTRDDKFIIAEQGLYKISLNINALTITITKTAGPKYFDMYLVGSAFATPLSMFRCGYAFLATAANLNGTMHFSNSADDSGDKYYASKENPGEEASLIQTPGYEWSFNGANSLYHISLFTKEGKEKAYVVAAQPYEQLYLIGSACDAGWTIDQALPMTKKDAYVQTWSGALKEGELKFTCDKSSDWYGAWYLASTVDKAPAGVEEPLLFLDKSRPETATIGAKELDQKWKITEAGNYDITLDQARNTVIILKK